jgi:hypothetical protein
LKKENESEDKRGPTALSLSFCLTSRTPSVNLAQAKTVVSRCRLDCVLLNIAAPWFNLFRKAIDIDGLVQVLAEGHGA